MATLQDLGMAVRSRRQLLRLTIKEAATAAGVSDTTWSQVEAGQQASSRTYIGVCTALGWTPDSYELILRDEDPIEAPSSAGDPIADLTKAVRDLTAMVDRLHRDLREGRR